MSNVSWWKKACVMLVLSAGTAIVAQAQIFNTLVSFNETDGADPVGSFVQGVDGNYYSTTAQGGVSSACGQNGGCGTVFKITAQGTLTTLYNFGANGFPEAGLTLANNGTFYGTTAFNEGTVFDMPPTGEVTTLYTFCTTDCQDGVTPVASLIQATNGNLFGTTMWGGAQDRGEVFETTPDGKLTTIHSFCGQRDCTDGRFPTAALIEAQQREYLRNNERRRRLFFPVQQPRRLWHNLRNQPPGFHHHLCF